MAAVRVYEVYSVIITKVCGKYGVVVQESLEQDKKLFVEVYRSIRMI
jgi:hypothetical protein